MSITVSTLGFPRIGPRRELKSALERFWAGKTNGQSLLADAAGLRAASWARQRSLGVTHIPSNDFSRALPPPGQTGCRLTNQSWFSISMITRDVPLKPRTVHYHRPHLA